MAAYYNEIDPYAAQWLRNLIAAGHIAPGDVDERSIVDVQPDDLAGYTQCHFFAGIGGWSYAARLAGFPDERELWTGSCPCQPFSVAGKQEGQADERHLWPIFFDLIQARRPSVVMGEQVAAAVGKDWLDGVHSDLEGIHYSCGAAVVPACAVDAPHRRDRLWFVADRDQREPRQIAGDVREVRSVPEAERRPEYGAALSGRSGEIGGYYVAHTISPRLAQRERFAGIPGRMGVESQGQDVTHDDTAMGNAQGVGQHCGSGSRSPRYWEASVVSSDAGSHVSNAERFGFRGEGCGAPETASAGMQGTDGQRERLRSDARPICNSRSWDGATWAIGSDGKARRVEPGICLLAHGVPARVGKLRALGNAIVPQVAAEVIGAYLDATERAA